MKTFLTDARVCQHLFYVRCIVGLGDIAKELREHIAAQRELIEKQAVALKEAQDIIKGEFGPFNQLEASAFVAYAAYQKARKGEK